MSTDLQPIMLVILGSLISLLGTVIALTLQMRLASQQARREVKIQDFRDLQAYLFAVSRLYAVVSEHVLMPDEQKKLKQPDQVWLTQVNIILKQIQDSPLNAIPIVLWLNDKTFQQKYTEITGSLDYVRQLLKHVQSGNVNVINLKEIHQRHMISIEEFNRAIDEAVKIAERKLVR